MSVSQACQHCGVRTENCCAGCQIVNYCSRECQTIDWRNHKRPCRQERIKQVVADLMKREVQWLKNLPAGDLEKMNYAQLPYHFDSWNHHLYFVHFALVLTGVNACHYHYVQEMDTWSEYMDEFRKNVFEPWFDSHMPFLQKRGFDRSIVCDTLEYCPCAGHAMPCRPGTCGNPITLKRGLLFWNKKHKDDHHVKRLFFPQEYQGNKELDLRMTKLELLRSMGLLASRYMVCKRDSDTFGAVFDIKDPPQFFKDDDACCSACFAILMDNEKAAEAGEYFAKCQKALAACGIPIKLQLTPISLDTNAAMDFSEDAFADLLVAAASGDLPKAIDMSESMAVESFLFREKLEAVSQLLRQRNSISE